MKYFKNQNCKFDKPVITMGTFDGVHLGHQQLLKKLKKEADKLEKKSVVITYYHHPLEIIHKKTFPYLLTEREDKEKLIKNIGIDSVVYLDFTPEMANMQAEEFLQNILISQICASKIIVGYDTHFGKKRLGNFEFLRSYASKYNFEIGVVEPLREDNKIISSSMIRDFVREGDVKTVAKYLGRDYSVVGYVTYGQRIGSKIGFPTINIQPQNDNKLIPGIGVYHCKVMIDNEEFIGVTNVGYSPTLKTTGIKEIETHILDFKGNLYNKLVNIIFVDRIRDEINFENEKQLIKQIENDIFQVRRYFYK